MMLLQTLQYSKKMGWSSKFPDLDSENTLILVFASPEFIKDQTPIKNLASHYPLSKIMGCSSSGEIYDTRIADKSISVAIAKFEKTKIKTINFPIDDASHSYDVGKSISTELSEKDLQCIFVLSEGLQVNGSELVRGLNSENKYHAVITGGLAGDGSQFKKTWIVFNGEIVSNRVAAVGLYGEHVRIGHGSRGGWDIFGHERRITRSKNNILYELDGKSALSLYKEYLGDKAADLPASGLLFPLAIRKDANDTKLLVRTLLGVDEKESSLIFAGDMPTGYLAQLMRANFDRLITGAKEAGKKALLENENENQNINESKNQNQNKNINENEKSPLLLISISCVGRRLLLGERTVEEVESVREIFPSNTQQVGFYSYGEISPYATGDCDLHNQTMTLTSIIEE